MQQDPSQQPAMPQYAPYPQPVPPAPAPSGTSKAKVWGAIAAGVSAIAAVASAIAAFTNSPSAPAVAQPAPASTVAAQPPASSGPGATAAAGAAGAAGAGTVRWSGKVVLGLEGIDLSQVPPRKASGLGARPAAGRSGDSSMMVKGTAVLWTAAGAPTAQGCKDLLATQSRKDVVVAEGDSVCLVDENSPIAVLKVTRTAYDEGSYGLIEGDLTTWNLRVNR